MVERSQAEHGIERVAVVDIDVHHGNGTQAAFAKNPTTFYASTHQVCRGRKYPIHVFSIIEYGLSICEFDGRHIGGFVKCHGCVEELVSSISSVTCKRMTEEACRI